MSKKKRDQQGKKSFIKKRVPKRIKYHKERKHLKKIIQEEYKYESFFNSNLFDETTSSYKAIINKMKQKGVIATENINFSLINMVNTYLKNSSCSEKKNVKFIQKFIEIIEILSMNKNEFVFWTLLIDEYMKKNPNNWILEILFYIGLCTKQKLSPNYSIYLKEYKNIDKNFNNWCNVNKILIEKEICLLNDFNKRFQELNYMKNFNKTIYYDYNSEVNYICNSTHIIEKKEANTKTYNDSFISKINEFNNLNNEKNEQKINKNDKYVNNKEIEININENECQNTSFNLNNFNFNENVKNNYIINNYIDEGVSIKNKIDLESNYELFSSFNSERKLSPNPYDDYNIFIDSSNDISPLKDYNLNILSEKEKLDEPNNQLIGFPFSYNYKKCF